jgi:hypothetical protein
MNPMTAMIFSPVGNYFYPYLLAILTKEAIMRWMLKLAKFSLFTTCAL